MTLALLSCLVVLVITHLLGEAFSDQYLNPPVALMIAVVYAITCIWMASDTDWKHWTWMGVGLVLSMAGIALFFLYILAGMVNRRPYEDLWLEITRALLIVGGPLLYYGYRTTRSTNPNGE